MIKYCRFFIAFCFICIGYTSYGQLIERPIPQCTDRNTNSRVLDIASDTLSLPFWDDFSQSNGRVDTSKWIGQNALVSFTKGLNLPSVGVVVFDGLDSEGVPYDIADEFVSPADSLSSKPIDLSNIAESQKSSVWISFFYQLRGLVEIPDVEDSIRLQFYQDDATWRTVWSTSGGLDNVNEQFQQVLLPLDRQSYFHEGFRFRFQSFGRITGPFDAFLIDYVYLNQGRSQLDNFYFDRSLATLPTYVLDGYSAVPIELFRNNPQQYVQRSEVDIFNLDNQIQPIDFSAVIKNRVTGAFIDSLNSKTVVNPILQGRERRTIQANLPDTDEWPLDDDSLYLETEFFITSGDLISNGINFRTNDTIRTSFTLHDYLAYDDNTAEFAAGINQSRGRLALQYYIPESANLSGIAIHFPQISPLANGQPLELFVWGNLSGEVGSILAKQAFTVNFGEGVDQFTQYNFELPVAVSDTFYIGFQQFTDNFIGIGLDKNYNNLEKVWYNVSDEWIQNDRVEGSLLMRPVFRQASYIITDVPKIEQALQLYPNPSTGLITIEGQRITQIAVYDMLGKQVFVDFFNDQNYVSINLSGLKPGLYVTKIQMGNQWHSRKVILK